MDTRHILVVDDKPTVAFFLCKTLERSNRSYRVSIAHSGEEALEILHDSPIDLLVTDLCMPGISGLELIRQVRATNPETRTILITAYGSDEVVTQARQLGICHYITKPFDVAHFTQVVHETLLSSTPPGREPRALGSKHVAPPDAPSEASARPAPGSGPVARSHVALPVEPCEAITRHLEDLRRDVGAQCVLLADMLGQPLAEVGLTSGLKPSTLLALLADGVATTLALGRQVGNGWRASLSFYAGARYEIYSASVGDNLFLAILYDCQVRASRIGVVWVYAQRAVKNLASIAMAHGAAAPVTSLDRIDSSPAGLLDTNPSSPSAAEELDTLFAEAPMDDLEWELPDVEMVSRGDHEYGIGPTGEIS